MKPFENSSKINGAKRADATQDLLIEILERYDSLEVAFRRLTGNVEDLEAPVAAIAGVFGRGGVLSRNGRLPRGLAGKSKKADRTLDLLTRHCMEIDLQLADLRGLIEAAADPRQVEVDGPRARKSEIRSIELGRRYKERQTWYQEFRADGKTFALPDASAKLLQALAADTGASPDEFVAFKSSRWLQRKLGIDSTTLATRFTRLGKKMAEADFAPGLVEKHRHGGAWRLRLRRR